MKIVLLGPPGAGKGTQAKSISNRYSIPHISTGDIFRKNISEATPLGIEAKRYMDKGLLVPDEVTINMVKDRLTWEDCKNGYLLDGFPRTVAQAEALETFLDSRDENIDTALLIDVPMEFILERMTGRRVCGSCGASYHVKFNPTKVEGTCDVCGGHEFFQREDDKPETVKRRLDVNIAQGEPIIAHYRELGLVSDIQGNQDIDDVFADVKKAIAAIK